MKIYIYLVRYIFVIYKKKYYYINVIYYNIYDVHYYIIYIYNKYKNILALYLLREIYRKKPTVSLVKLRLVCISISVLVQLRRSDTLQDGSQTRVDGIMLTFMVGERFIT